MLSALELNGFKSFADKTRFEFPAGITVVVGPNGSGKSNIVDAVKWVLGAQSVKSLRGKEMADVIFNGTGHREAVNTADVTLTFDNSSGLLSADTKDVLITRRVYRSGEGEYFINRIPCRLRDIRELLAGTGIATDAYSIIEQGKVDVMLQASPKDRRVLFEEAAGISRFKAKKAEAERRLARVEQNLLRLTDIVEEVEGRLRRIRAQATKARRYEEYTQRLKTLRLAAASRDLAKLNDNLLTCKHEAGELSAKQEALSQRLAAVSDEAKGRQAELRACDETLGQSRAEAATVREGIVRLSATVDQQRQRERELDDEIGVERKRLAKTTWEAAELASHIRDSEARCHEAGEASARAAARLAQARNRAEALQQEVQLATTRVREARGSRERVAQQATSLESQISVLRSQLASARAAEQKCRVSAIDLSRERESLEAELKRCEAAEEELAAAVDRYGRQLHESQQIAGQHRKMLSQQQSELADLKLRRTAATGRAAVLDELQQRLEGVGAGTKHVLLEARNNPAGELAEVRGLVADLVRVDVELAPLVELVLGHRANVLVVESPQTVAALAARLRNSLLGRAGIIAATPSPPAPGRDSGPAGGGESPHDEPPNDPAVVNRLDRLVDAAPRNAPLVGKLLGTTWLVEDLPAAFRLAAKHPDAGFVTRDGEYLAPDGTLLLGPKDGEAGMLSRQSELTALSRQIESIDADLDEKTRQIARTESSIHDQDRLADALSPEHSALTGRLSEQRLRTSEIRNRLQQADVFYQASSKELEAAERQARDVAADLTTSERATLEAAENLARAEAELASAEEALDTLRAKQGQAEQDLGNARVEEAKAEQEVRSLQVHVQTSRRRATATQATLETGRGQWRGMLDRRDEARRAALHASGELALAHLAAEEIARSIDAQRQELAALRAAVQDDQARRESLAGDLRTVERSLQERELTARQVEHEMQLLIERYREEYEVDLAEWPRGDAERPDDRVEPSEREREIADLRRKINNLGAVNLEAVSELNDLEERHARLGKQLHDLTSAKDSLEQIIARINVDSRKMFLATIDVVRKHFQELFRRLFGGGQADLILEGDETEDVLERGIEIVARPPGKEPRSISLLSGGEKTLTCVALLFAVFRSRPSPFCLLDEVDAALDEANIERFALVLREFLDTTQFIVVTHSKRTMTFADTLYGVTMQETGISKPVSVRFDDRSSEDRGPDRKEVEETQAA